MHKLRIITCLATESACYKKGYKIHASGIPQGVQVHSSGTVNPNLKRWINPSASDPNKQALINLIGKAGANHWNKSTNTSKMANAWIGKLADGSPGVVQCTPWDFKTWLSGSGGKGNANNLGYIGFEIAEDNEKNTKYLESVLNLAILLTAYWVAKYKIPIEKVQDHRELAALGLASGHADIRHLKRNGWVYKDDGRDIMVIFREHVQKTIQEGLIVEYFDGVKVTSTEYINADVQEEPKPIEPEKPELPETLKEEYYVLVNSKGLNQRELPDAGSKSFGQWKTPQMLLISETTPDKKWGYVRDYHHWVMLEFTVPYEPETPLKPAEPPKEEYIYY